MMLSSSNIEENTIMCPICLDVFVEPITLICDHELCKQCYNEHFNKADFRCPMCKKRLSTWARKAASSGTLVNQSKWKYIQDNFSELVQKRLNGEETDTFTIVTSKRLMIAETGEVHNEYLEMKDKFEKERQAQKDEEESASLKLIEQLVNDEKEEAEKVRQKQIEQDEKLATVISAQLNTPVSPNTVGKKLLRSTTTSAKNRKANFTPVVKRRNTIDKYCVRKPPFEREKETSALNNIMSPRQLSPSYPASNYESNSSDGKRCKIALDLKD